MDLQVTVSRRIQRITTKKEEKKKKKREATIPLCCSISVVSFGQVSITFTNAWNPGCSIALSMIQLVRVRGEGTRERRKREEHEE